PNAQFFASVGYAPDVRDSDGDGIPNAKDKCPLVPEDKDGFQDDDGCPDPDNDGDDVPDGEDKCPNDPEAVDGFQDDDGCPDPDNDHDGIPDVKDKCPNEPETVNGIKDDDGCPDTGGKTLVALDGDRLSVDKMPTAASDQVVEQMQLVMAGHSEV